LDFYLVNKFDLGV